MDSNYLHHFSEDGAIEVFEPHVPKTNPTQAPAVWTIDAERAPLYWFPRDCPRAATWPQDESQQSAFSESFGTDAQRVHAIEYGWLERMRSVRLFRYDFEPAYFDPWVEAAGQWVSREPVEPVSVSAVGDLLELHDTAGIELRLLSELHSFVRRIRTGAWEFSAVRMANAL